MSPVYGTTRREGSRRGKTQLRRPPPQQSCGMLAKALRHVAEMASMDRGVQGARVSRTLNPSTG